MTKARVPADELKKMVAAELIRTVDGHNVSPDCLVILPRRSGWWATLSNRGPRIDEALLAAVGEVGQRLCAGFDLAA